MGQTLSQIVSSSVASDNGGEHGRTGAFFEIGQKVQVVCSYAPSKYFESHAIIVRHPWSSSFQYFDTYEIEFDDGNTMKISRNNIKRVDVIV
mmetsp:Transcript_1583/g.2275  ORF Transcript_1583/g.2275 Transcript_1583/m.2275 type:complete len:92 (-) Transcript_1583:108-383(-)